jgi:hypothetical protein
LGFEVFFVELEEIVIWNFLAEEVAREGKDDCEIADTDSVVYRLERLTEFLVA